VKDRLTPIGIGAALVAIVASMVLDGGSPAALLRPPALILVFGGTVAASVAGVMRRDVKQVKEVVKQAFGTVDHDPDEDIARLVRLAEVARREGLLALEKASSEIDDPFFRKAVEMTVDGVDAEEIREVLEAEIDGLRERHRMGIKFFTDMGGFAPTLGILGTVIGLVHVLASLNNPGTLGPAIASAFTATLWGVLSANIFWLPISNKLKRASELEVHAKHLVLDGVLAIQAGSSPRMVQARLQAYVAPKDRKPVGRRAEEVAA
jgi:chemotaxis protein MotA